MVSAQSNHAVPRFSLSDIVKGFKMITTKKYSDGVKKNTWLPFDRQLWQKSFHDRVMRHVNE